MVNYIGLQNTTSRLIQANGQSVTFKQVVSAYDTTTGKTTQTINSSVVKAVVLNYRMDEINQPNSLVKENDRRVLLAAKDLNVTPSVKDKLVIASDEYTIVGVPKMVNPGGIPLVYELHVRK